uniref:Uncharacterized protein n=1 Tax=Anopheles quadriannulatus TaxID=34691 RepID=A0A182XQN1_ANOQN
MLFLLLLLCLYASTLAWYCASWKVVLFSLIKTSVHLIFLRISHLLVVIALYFFCVYFSSLSLFLYFNVPVTLLTPPSGSAGSMVSLLTFLPLSPNNPTLNVEPACTKFSSNTNVT